MMNLKKNINICKYYLFKIHESGPSMFKNILLWSIIAGFVEMLSLGMVVPIIVGMIDVMENGFVQNSIISNLEKYMSINAMFLLMTFSIVIIFYMKITFIKWFQRKMIFSANLYEVNISTSWLKNMANWDYSKFILKDTGVLLRTISSDISNSVHLVFLPSLGLISEIISIIGIVVATYFISEIVFLIECTMMLVFLLFNYMKRNKANEIKEYGRRQQIYESRRLLSAKSFFNSYKEMKVHNNASFIIKHYRDSVVKKAHFSSLNQLIQQVPRLYVELILVLTIIISLLIMYFIQSEDVDMKTNFAVLVVAGMRVAPSFTKIIGNISSISFGFQSLKWIVEDFQVIRKDRIDPKNGMCFSRLNWGLYLKNISISRNTQSEREVFNGANFSILKGDKILVKGKSGSGKSTLVDLISGLLRPNSGDMFIKINQKEYPVNGLKISYMPQQFSLFKGDIDSNITFGLEYKKELVTKVSGITGVLENIVPRGSFTKKIKILDNGESLSGGQKQRIGIARALYREADLLILDEATNALDSESESKILHSIVESYPQITILFITHNENIDESIFNRKILIKNGKINDK
jgi:ATP-binding cassette, subfamily B, bacterial PglK